MSNSVHITVPLVPPSVNSYVRHTRRGGHYVTPEAKAFKEAVVIIAKGKKVVAQMYCVETHIFYGKGQRGDLDNRAKLILDGLVDAKVIHSDAAVTVLNMRKHHDEFNPRTEITVTAL